MATAIMLFGGGVMALAERLRQRREAARERAEIEARRWAWMVRMYGREEAAVRWRFERD